jgi:DNA polymerase-3 subunit gamma/tau
MARKKTPKTAGGDARGDLLGEVSTAHSGADAAPPAEPPPPALKQKSPASSPDYTVVARRYRPQQFTDLLGQEATAQALMNALKTNRVAHAYLFTGARGVGKTSTARILAKALNCDKGPTPTPCDQCESCRAIALGEDMDVLEIDGASNNKVEEVRELRQNVQYKPSRSRYKIYIIDEVHMLSTSAFNALLKTLEEPPSHVKFIFATTEVQKIPVTILSRCQRFDLTLIGTKKIEERLRQIVREEQAEADDAALDLLARRAAGSMRDAQSLLDQALAFSERKLTVDLVHRLLGTAHEDQVAELAAAVLGKDVPRALGTLGQIAESGIQLGEFIDQLLDYWRDLMLLKTAGPQFDGLTFSQSFRAVQQGQADANTLDTIMAGLEIWAATKGRLRASSHGRVLLEMAVVRISRLENLMPLAEIARQLAVNGGLPRASAPTMPAARKMAPRETGYDEGRGWQREGARVQPAIPAISAPGLPSSPIPLDPANVKQIQQMVLEMMPPMLKASLEKAQFAANSAPNCLVLRFPARYNIDKDYCLQSGSQDRLEEALQKITGQEVDVRYETADDETAAAKEGARVPRAVQMRRDAAQVPLVQRALEGMGAQLIRADEGFGTTGNRVETPESEEPPDV